MGTFAIYHTIFAFHSTFEAMTHFEKEPQSSFRKKYDMIDVYTSVSKTLSQILTNKIGTSKEITGNQGPQNQRETVLVYKFWIP